MATIYPSLIGSDQLNLKNTITLFDPLVVGYHLDVMSTDFVPKTALVWEPSIINSIAEMTKRQVWVHLMADNPQKWINLFNLPNGSTFCFHFEAIGQNVNLIKQIKEKNWKVSIAINPETSVEKIFPLLNLLDQIVIMSVEPGFVGQPFISSVVNKIDPLIGYRASSNLNFTIAMDGGINKDNIKELAEKGVDNFAVSSAIFGQPDPVAAFEELKELIK